MTSARCTHRADGGVCEACWEKAKINAREGRITERITVLGALQEIKRMCAAPFRTDVESGRVAIARLALIERFADAGLGAEPPSISNDGPTGNRPDRRES